jgi:hypothetical protein
MKYVIDKNTKKHISGHFDEKNSLGSCFRVDHFPNVDILLATLEKYQPVDQIEGSDNRISDVYLLSDFEFIGWYGIGLKINFPGSSIQFQSRNGFSTEFIETAHLPKTKYVTVVYKEQNGNNNIITLFPGPYAPAFPHIKMKAEEFNYATQYWSDHILLKKAH